MIVKNKKYKVGKHVLAIGEELKREILMCDCSIVGEIENIIKDGDNFILIACFPHKFISWYSDRHIIYNPENDIILI